MMKKHIALITGVIPKRISEKMYKGKVVEPGPETKKVIMKKKDRPGKMKY